MPKPQMSDDTAALVFIVLCGGAIYFVCAVVVALWNLVAGWVV